MRVDHWKIHLAVKNTWLGSAEKIPGGLIVDIKLDPQERTADTGGHLLWMKEKTWLLPLLAPPMKAFAQSMKEFPPSQEGTGIGVAALMHSLSESPSTD